MNLLLLGIFGAIGGIVRESVAEHSLWGITLVNLFGSLLLGGVYGILPLVRSTWIGNWLKYGLATGFTGSVTTFSSYIGDANRLFRIHPLAATAFTVLLPLASIALAWFADWLMKMLSLSSLRRRLGDYAGHE